MGVFYTHTQVWMYYTFSIIFSINTTLTHVRVVREKTKDKITKIQLVISFMSFNPASTKGLLFGTLLNTIEIWLILPVVICLFQGLSHACLRITALQESAHGSLHQTQSAAKLLRKRNTGYLVRNAKLIHELKSTSQSTGKAVRRLAWWVSLRMNESKTQRFVRSSITE